ncbi:MAG: bifunctional adenosylcobinamide kinase/adenosylcobinamide-phosphate guanylyltransferase [Clostridiales bacterium]|nr:bifunctional adenosylcobinamide kinase/adenosylcobinamide-phosphate guanylyltransferase [Clostridiales bacterium]
MGKTTSYADLHLITGGSGSGKSSYAESCVMAASASDCFRRIYIATMIPYGEEGRQRVERHRQLRAQKTFETVECYTGLEQLNLFMCLQTDPGQTILLLECMSNLVANEIFEPNGAGEDTVNAILRGVRVLRQQAKHLVIVTNEVFSDGMIYDADTMRYLSYLGAVNQALAEQAETVTEVVYGIPLALKVQGSEDSQCEY